jgi:hypothetical protein
MGELLAVYLFGSAARGEVDERSDLDLLAVVADRAGKVVQSEVERHVPKILGSLEPSISWYGFNRLREMFRNGELFAWHLYRETTPLFEARAVLASLGTPAPYLNAAEDVTSFEAILSGIPGQLAASPQNAVYEMGLIYVCLRNICMAASWSLCPNPDFSRYSPFSLRGVAPVPISRLEYDLAMSCRLAGQRGMALPQQVSPSEVAHLYDRLTPWIAALRRCLESRNGRRGEAD